MKKLLFGIALCGVSMAASAEEPEAAPVKPSVAAVSPKSRTRRRKKGDEEEKELGDVFISIESMNRNAASLGVDENEELRRLLVHGILHLRGMDHGTNDFSTEPMLIEQERIMKELGFLASVQN